MGLMSVPQSFTHSLQPVSFGVDFFSDLWNCMYIYAQMTECGNVHIYAHVLYDCTLILATPKHKIFKNLFNLLVFVGLLKRFDQ